MTDEDPWWLPLRKALVKKAADLILAVSIEPKKEPVVLDAEFEDLPAKGPRKRRKALPARPVEKKEDRPLNPGGSA